MTQAGTLQVRTDGGVDKLLIHDSDTNSQAVGDLMKVCCCEGFVRLVECESTADCASGNCPSSGTNLPCDEDSDGTNDFDHVVYIDEGEWEQRAKFFTHTDCVGGGSWNSVLKTGVTVRVGCKCYLTSGVAPTIPDTCQRISVTDLETIPLAPGVVLPEVGFLNIDVDGGTTCDTCCTQKWYLATPCPQGGCCTPLNEFDFECNSDNDPYYVPCALIKSSLGGNADDHIGKIVKINSSTGPCVTIGADTVCRLPYGCVSGVWQETDRVASSIVGSPSTDCCVCLGHGLECCIFACVPPNASTYTVSIPSVPKGNAFECNCNDSGNPFSEKCDNATKEGVAFSQPRVGPCGCAAQGAHRPNDACVGDIAAASFSVELPDPTAPGFSCECEGGFYSTTPLEAGNFSFFSGDTCGANATSGCPMLTGGPQDEVSPVGYYGAGIPDPNGPDCLCSSGANCGGTNPPSFDPCCGRFTSPGPNQNCCRDVDCNSPTDGIGDSISDQGLDTNKSHYSSAALGCGIVLNQPGWGLIIRFYQGAQGDTQSGAMKACYGDDASAVGRVWTFTCVKDSSTTDPSGDYSVIDITSSFAGIRDCMFTSLANALSGTSIFHEKFITGGAKITVS